MNSFTRGLSGLQVLLLLSGIAWSQDRSDGKKQPSTAPGTAKPTIATVKTTPAIGDQVIVMLGNASQKLGESPVPLAQFMAMPELEHWEF